MKETKAHGLWYMICVSVHIANASWTTSTNLLIHSDDQMSIGVHNDTIWLIGGRDFPTQLTQYKVRTQTMTNFGDNALTASIKGYGQYWTQQNHMVYIIDQSTGNSLCTYNMITNQFQSNWMSITFNTYVGDDGCLASDAQYLYVTGGEDGNALGLKTLQMLSLSTHQWTTSPPNMNVGRKYHACIVHNTYLWAMGGTGCTYNCPNALTSVPTDIPIKSTIYGPINTTLEEATNHTISSTSNENIYSSESLLNELNEGVEGIWLLIASITIGSVLCVVQIGVVLYCVRRKTKDTQKMIQKSMKEKEPGAEDQDGMEQDNSMIMNRVHHNEELVEEIVSDHNDNVAGDDETLVKDGDMVQYEGVVQGAGWRK
eukprot:970244_1